jgi:uncharacterized protein
VRSGVTGVPNPRTFSNIDGAVLSAPETEKNDRPRLHGSWFMLQRWHNVLFAHWRVPAEWVSRLLPKGITLDTFGGDAWVSAIPFYMSDVRLRWMPPIPTAHAFAELNVRTYVTHGGVAGIWFLSLDAESTLAVLGARFGAALPYYRAAMDVRLGFHSVEYRSDRLLARQCPAQFDMTYTPRGLRPEVVAGSLDYFLVERYALFSGDRDRLWRMDIDHPRWQLYDADAVIRHNTVLSAAGLHGVTGEPLLHFAPVQDVHFWRPIRVS